MDTDLIGSVQARHNAHLIVQRKATNPNGFRILKDAKGLLYGHTTERGTVSRMLKTDNNVLVYDEDGQVIAQNYIGGVIDGKVGRFSCTTKGEA
ncbi:hypothetical protein [Bacillus phage BC-T25]|nr:hypothetical protein [Bacillus phage BC-T25]